MNRFILKTVVAGCLIVFLSLPAQAAMVLVEAEDGNFYLTLSFKSEMLPTALLARLTDFQNLHQISPVITESSVISRADGGKVIVWKRINGCITFFCRELQHTEIVTVDGNKIMMITIPERSDFEFGQSHWIVMPGAVGSRVKFSSVLKPSFSLPPLMGTWLMKQSLQDELQTTARLLGDMDAE